VKLILVKIITNEA